MDGWANDDSTSRAPQHPLGAVARSGMAAFVKSESAVGGTNNGRIVSKIEVVASKREQKRQADTQLMPPPPPPMRTAPIAAAVPAGQVPSPGAAGPAPPTFQGPAWASTPPPGAVLEVQKDGVAFEEIPLTKAATLFGRNLLADVPLDHPSVSRQHAAVCFQGMTGKCLVLDLGSTHKTFINGRTLVKDSPTELQEGVELRFGASSRAYFLKYKSADVAAGPSSGATAGVGMSRQPGSSSAAGAPAIGSLSMPPPPPRTLGQAGKPASAGTSGGEAAAPSRRVSFAGGESGDDGKPSALEQVIGYSDSRDFVAGVGPKPTDQQDGQFSKLVSSTTVTVSPRAPSSQDKAASKPKANSDESPLQSGVRPELRNFLQDIRRRPTFGDGGGLYDEMPPACH